MGKTLVITSLILAEPANLKPIPDETFQRLYEDRDAHDGAQANDDVDVKDPKLGKARAAAAAAAAAAPAARSSSGSSGSLKGGEPLLHVKATLVVVNNTLVQQWVDEIAKFAPGLEVRPARRARGWPLMTTDGHEWPLMTTDGHGGPLMTSDGHGGPLMASDCLPHQVHTYYASKQNKERALSRLREADVLITTPHMFGPSHLPRALLKNVAFHRLVSATDGH